jgi:hypothetical protein
MTTFQYKIKFILNYLNIIKLNKIEILQNKELPLFIYFFLMKFQKIVMYEFYINYSF